MPSILTHYKFCKDRVDGDLSQIAYLGAQGPDPFFFYATALKGKIRLHSKLGSKMHRMDPAIMYEYLIEYANGRIDIEKEILYSFIKGMMYHYCVDRRCHPYIFYKSGFKTKDNKKGHQFHLSHSALETYIDTLLMERLSFNIRPADSITVPVEQLKLVSVMMYSFVKNVLHIEGVTSSSYYNAVKATQRLYRIVYSKKGIKKKIYSILLRRTSINTLCMPKKVKNNNVLDCLNENKELWLDPVTGEEHKESFLELLDLAKMDADIVDRILNASYNNETYKDELYSFTNRINHHGNIEGDEKKYYSLVWNKNKK